MHEFMSRFSIIHRQSEMYLDRQIKKDRLTASQYTYILVICENPGISQEQISIKLKIDKGSVARTIKIFEKKRYVTRKISSEDKRLYQIFPTPKASTLYKNIYTVAADSENLLTEGFSDSERTTLMNLLDKVIANLNK